MIIKNINLNVQDTGLNTALHRTDFYISELAAKNRPFNEYVEYVELAKKLIAKGGNLTIENSKHELPLKHQIHNLEREGNELNRKLIAEHKNISNLLNDQMTYNFGSDYV